MVSTMRLVYFVLMVLFLFNIVFIPPHDNEAERKPERMLRTNNLLRSNNLKLEEQNSSNLSFTETTIWAANNTTFLREINVIDSDGNGWPEIAVQKPGLGGGIFMWEYTNSSFFLKTKITPTANYNPLYIDMRLLVTDLQLDGWFDIINNLYRFSGGRNNSFSQNITLVGYDDDYYILSGIAIGDVDGDGDFDIMVSNAGTASQNIVCLGPFLNL